MAETRLIALDWGTSSFRARRLDREGRVLDLRRTQDGILTVKEGRFEEKLRDNIGDWLDPAIPCIASGMITSRQGWVETPYVPCPASRAALAANVVQRRLADGVRIGFIPGVNISGGIHDVMRGEETQILGVMDEGLALHPGTHSKWALVEGGAIRHFATFMTGELFAVLLDHSILGRMVKGRDHDEAAFLRGVEAGARAAALGTLTHELFGARALSLADKLAPNAIASYISGILIGCEVASARNLLGLHDEAPLVFGAAALVDRYLAAFSALRRKAVRGPQDATVKGLIEIARLLTWL